MLFSVLNYRIASKCVFEIYWYAATLENEHLATSKIHLLSRNGPYLEYSSFGTLVLIFTCSNMCTDLAGLKFPDLEARNENRHTSTLEHTRTSLDVIWRFSRRAEILFMPEAIFWAEIGTRRLRWFFFRDWGIRERYLYFLHVLNALSRWRRIPSPGDIQSSYRLYGGAPKKIRK